MDPLRVMTFNVRLDTEADGDDAWPNRRDLLAGTIRFHAPDVVGLQEPLVHQLEYLEDALAAYEWVGDSRRVGAGEGEHTPVGFRTGRFTLLSTETFWLSETPDDPGSVGWDATHPRVATVARFDDATADRQLLIVNTHLDHDGIRARRGGAELVADRTRELSDGTIPIVTGDLNCTTGEPAHQRLDGLALGDDRRLVPAADVAEYCHGPDTSRTDFHDLVPDRTIDHVFLPDDCTVEAHVTATDRDDRRYPSDHLPVVVDLSAE